MSVELVHRDVLLLGQDVQADLEGGQGGQEVGAHEVRQGEGAVGSAGEDGTALVQVRDALAGEVVEAQQAAAVGIALQGQLEQLGEQSALVLGRADGLGKLAEELHPGVDVGGAVVAVDHGNLFLTEQ